MFLVTLDLLFKNKTYYKIIDNKIIIIITLLKIVYSIKEKLFNHIRL